MAIRSILPASAADPDALARALGSGADAVLINLRPAPPHLHGDGDAIAAAVAALSDSGRSAGGPELWIGLGPLDSGEIDEELAAVCRHRPDALVLPRVESAADVQHLGAMLSVQEAEAGLDDAALRIVAMAETAGALFGLNTVSRASRRMAALAWDGEALARDLGADEAREADGRWTDPLQTARTLLLAACADARLSAIDCVFSDAAPEGFRRECETARRDGFSAKLALTPAQAAAVNKTFSRS